MFCTNGKTPLYTKIGTHILWPIDIKYISLIIDQN